MHSYLPLAALLSGFLLGALLAGTLVHFLHQGLLKLKAHLVLELANLRADLHKALRVSRFDAEVVKHFPKEAFLLADDQFEHYYRKAREILKSRSRAAGQLARETKTSAVQLVDGQK